MALLLILFMLFLNLHAGNFRNLLTIAHAQPNTIEKTKATGESDIFSLIAENKLTECEEFLEANSTRVNQIVNSKEQTGLIVAVYHGKLEIVKLFLKHKCTVHLSDSAGYSALWHAVNKTPEDTALEFVNLLLEHNADPLLNTLSSFSPFLLAFKKQYPVVITRLKETGELQTQTINTIEAKFPNLVSIIRPLEQVLSRSRSLSCDGDLLPDEISINSTNSSPGSKNNDSSAEIIDIESSSAELLSDDEDALSPLV